MSYKYNADGIRTQKTFTDNAVKYYYKHDYIVDGAKIVAETINYVTYFGTNTTEVLYYYYDEAGAPTGIKYNNNVYYFQKNLQGDIIRILNSSGTIVATYTYDAWGNIISSTDTSGVSIGTKNPFRYRGYYYDTETGLYYLNSRYYDPQVGRFLNADGLVSTGQGLLGSNMFAYCGNNPTMFVDPWGDFPWFAIIVLAVLTIGGATYGALYEGKLMDNSKNTNPNILPNIDESSLSIDKEKLDDKLENNIFSSENSIIRKENNDTLNKDYILKDELKKEKLTFKDRLVNTFIGASFGLAIGGAGLSLFGMGGTLIVGSTTTTIAFFGGTGPQTFAIGALAYDLVAMLVAPVLGLTMETIEISP